MKTSNAGIDTILAGNARFAADLYTFYFAEGTTRWTGANTNLTDGVDTWLSTGPIVMRGSGRCTAGLEVDTIQLVLAPGSRSIGAQTIKSAALSGSFDGIRVLVQRAYMSTWGTIPGLITVFDGITQGDAAVGSSSIRMTVRSALSKLSTEIPRRLIEPSCSYRLYETACGVDQATWTHTRTAAAGSTSQVVKLSSSSTNANVGGMLYFSSGALSGLKRSIQAVSGVDVTLSVALPAAPATGDAVSVSKGCDKTRASCRAFSAISRFGGFPDMPTPDAVQSPELGVGSGGR